MESSVRIFPPHSVIIVSERGFGEVPTSLGEEIVAATKSCIAVGCRSEIDGDTEIVLGTVNEVEKSEYLVFSGVLFTPKKSIAVQTVFNEVIFELAVPFEHIEIKIWVNDLSEPNRIVLGVKV